MASAPVPKIRGLELLDASTIPTAGFVLIPNRLSYRELCLLEKVLEGREITYLVDGSHPYDPLLRAHLDKPDVDALEFRSAVAAPGALGDTLHPLVAKGRCVVFAPGATTALPGTAFHIPAGVLSTILETGVTALPLFVDRPREVALEIETDAPRPDSVFSFGKVLERESVTPANFQEHMLAAGEAAFSAHPVLGEHLARCVIKGLKRCGGSAKLHDGNDGTELGYDRAFAAAAALGKQLRKETDRPRIGIVLPPGKGGLIANLAVLLAGKVPVNLNFTAGTEAVKSAIKQADIDRLVTADAFVRKVPNFPWPPNKQLVLLERVLPPLKKKIIFWAIARKLLPAGALASMLGIPKKGGDKEAVLLFTSGSSGMPKGVVLTHRNLLANVAQFSTRLGLHRDAKVLACLPLFHSFGSTVTLWYPMLEGIDLVTYPSPLEPPKLAKLIEAQKVTVLLATPTFLRGYMRRVEPAQLASLKFVITGAEKLPAKLAAAFTEKFGLPILEGYGLTETSPVSNVNMHDPEPASGQPALPSYRPGSVGQPLPGVAVRITGTTDDKPLPLHESGMIWLRGANIFTGYLDMPQQSEEVLHDGWFRTGDIGRVDADGFLYIEGRLSRFSKIGGEMVPHETVEDAIGKALEIDTDDEKKIAVLGVPDEAKGEALVLLTTLDLGDQSMTELRYSLLEDGVSSLWIPKRVVKVDEIPVLASGKLDIQRCDSIARSGAAV